MSYSLTHSPECVAYLSSRQPPNSPRPPLARCSETEFLDDVCAFLTSKRGKKLARGTFPDAQVGGSQLDLFTLYKEVVSRGGYKCAPRLHHARRGMSTFAGVCGMSALQMGSAGMLGAPHCQCWSWRI
jgi:hypothetical protein